MMLRRSIYGSLVQALYMIALIHFHNLLATVESVSGPVYPFGGNIGGKRGSRGLCPYTATRSFLGRQGAFIVRAISPFGSRAMPDASAMESALVRQVNGVPDARMHVPKTSETLFVDSILSAQRFNKRLYDSRLYSTTSTGAETQSAAVSEEEIKSKKQKAGKKQKQKKSTDPLEVVVLGLSHHHAKVEVREKVAIPEDDWNSAAAELCSYPSIQEAAPLSTCNRFEMYLAGENQYEVMRDAMKFLEVRSGGTLDQKVLRSNTFILSGEDAIWHLLKVSAGLDSLIVGEGQILAQVKRCYEHGIEKDGQAGKVISRMLNTAVSAGKRVRSETGISKGAVSISSAAAEFTNLRVEEDLGKQSISDARITILGAGKMARLLLVHLQTQGVKKVHIVNRSPDRVIALREEFPDLQIDLSMLDNMWKVIGESDVVYPCTYSETTIVNPEELEECMKARTAVHGIQFVDISVPRNVHPDCGDISGVFSYNVDDLKAVVERNTAKRRKEMVEAEVILREEMGKYVLWQQSLGAIPTIAKLQEKAEKMRVEELAKVSKRLNNLDAKDLETVERLSKGIVNKLLHGPMNHLRQQKTADDTRASIQQVREAFQLEEGLVGGTDIRS
jgi:glutamyl-tRNA reductase